MSAAEEAWSAEYARIKQDIVRQRSQGTLTPESQLREHADALRKLGESLKLLRKDVQNNSGGHGVLTHSEISRRETIMENLRKQLPLMSTANILLQTSAPSSGGDGCGKDASKAPTDIEMQDVANPLGPSSGSTRGASAAASLTGRGLMQRQQEVIKQQDADIDVIAKGVGRLHDHAQAIGAEAQLHNNILEGLDDNVDSAAEELRAEAKHADAVRKKTQMCCLYMCLLLEICVTVMLLVIVFEYEGGFQPQGSKYSGGKRVRRFLRGSLSLGWGSEDW